MELLLLTCHVFLFFDTVNGNASDTSEIITTAATVPPPRFQCPGQCEFTPERRSCECGNIVFKELPMDGGKTEFFMRTKDPLTDIRDLEDLGLDLGSNFEWILLKCEYGGSYKDILQGLKVTNMTSLTVDTHLTEASLQGFSSLPFRIHQLQLQNGITQLLPTSGIPAEGFNESVHSFAISNTRIVSVPNHFFYNLPNLKSLDIFHNQKLLSLGTEAFLGLAKLKKLSITENENLRALGLAPLSSLQSLSLIKESFQQFHPSLLSQNNRVTDLKISTAHCKHQQCTRSFNSSHFKSLPELKWFSYEGGKHVNATFTQDSFKFNLRLSQVGIEKALLLPHHDLALVQHLKNLKILNLTSLGLKRVSEDTIPDSVSDIRLSDNYFSCYDCPTVNVLVNLRDSEKLKDNVAIVCHNEKIALKMAKHKYCSSIQLSVTFIVCLGVLLPLTLLLVVFVFLFYRFNLYRVQAVDVGTFDSDAFISFENSDEELACEIQTLLEEVNEYKCIVHTRDFEPGEVIMQNIVKAVTESRTTIVILSKLFLQSQFCNQELAEAERQGKRILVIMRSGDKQPSTQEIHERPIIESYVKSFTYLEEEDPGFDEKIVKFLEGKKFEDFWHWLCWRNFRKKKEVDYKTESSVELPVIHSS